MSCPLLLLLLLATYAVVGTELTGDQHTISQPSLLTPDPLTVNQSPSQTSGSKSPSLDHRMAQLERVVLEQDARLSRQDNLLHQQSQQLARQEALLHQRDADSAVTQRHLHDMRAQLAHFKGLLRAQDDKLSVLQHSHRQQGSKLTGAHNGLRHLHVQLSNQEDLIGQLNVKVSDQEDLIGQLKVKVSDQEDLISQLKGEVWQRDTLLQHPNLGLAGQQHFPRQKDKVAEGLWSHTSQVVSPQLPRVGWKAEMTGQSADGQVNDDSEQVSSQVSAENVSFSPHDVALRADDGGPLEEVVTHISQQVTEMSADIQALKNSDVQQTHDIRDALTSTFVRWGSSTCDDSSELVYSGVVGGSLYSHTGAATNYLCLTMSPVFDSHAIPPGLAYLYGGEYETYDSHDDYDPVCAVCRSSFPTTVMIPGTNVCTPGWHLLYSGYLMAGAYSHVASTEYICVDSDLQEATHSSADELAKVTYFTLTRCGTLPCPPYAENKVVTCVVCAK